jgi:hypothetical protein
MGEGLKRVCKLCGGMTAKGRDGSVVKYDADGKIKSRTKGKPKKIGDK